MTKKEFLELIEKFLADTGMQGSVFGLKALGDPCFVNRVRAGRECREATQAKVLTFINNYKEKE